MFGNGVVLDETPFYAFSGGQLCDKGTLDGIRVLDVIKMPNGQHLHVLEDNPFNVDDIVFASVDVDYREATRKNHSSAHLLQASLQSVLGSHVHQQGSQVGPEYCRFDFNNYNSLTDEEILKVEDLVNEYINEAHPVVTKVLPIEEAKSLGAMALFGEKYGSHVRVVDMGISKEFCAGTHVVNTEVIEKFAVYSCESIGSGVFRITASTGSDAMYYVKESCANLVGNIEAVCNKAFDLVKEAKDNGIELVYGFDFLEPQEFGYRYILALRKALASAQNAMKNLEKEYNAKKSQSALSNLSQFDNLIENNMLFTEVQTVDSNLLKDMATALKNNKNLNVVFLAGVSENKVTFVCATKEGFDASMLVKEAAKVCGGGGGGKKDLAQAGGKDPSKVNDAILKVKELC